MRNGFLSFIAHVGQSKRFSAEFAVARIDDEVMFFAERADHRQDVDATFVFDASERL